MKKLLVKKSVVSRDRGFCVTLFQEFSVIYLNSSSHQESGERLTLLLTGYTDLQVSDLTYLTTITDLVFIWKTKKVFCWSFKSYWNTYNINVHVLNRICLCLDSICIYMFIKRLGNIKFMFLYDWVMSCLPMVSYYNYMYFI